VLERRSYYSILFRYLPVTLVFFVLFIARVNAQSSNEMLSLRELYPKGAAPTVPSDMLAHSYVGTAIDTVHHLIYLKLNHRLWSYSISENRWSEPDSLLFDYEINDMAYDTKNQRLIFWDRGVGRVVIRDDSGKYHRLDHSFDQRNQYGHLGWFDSGTGRIYAFGGYGLFTSKNIVTYYDPTGEEWFLLDITDPEIAPKRQTGVMGIFDSKNNIMYSIAATQDDRNALWQLSIAQKSWKVIGYLNPRLEKYTSKFFTLDYWYHDFIPSKHLAFFSTIDLEKQNELRLMIFDTQSGKLAFLPLQSQALPTGVECANVLWSPTTQSLILVLWQYMPSREDFKAAIYTIPLENLDKLSRYVDTQKNHLLSPAPVLANNETSHLFYLIIGCLIGISVMFIVDKTLRKRENDHVDGDGAQTTKPVATEPSYETVTSDDQFGSVLPDSRLTILLKPPVRFYYNGDYIPDDLPEHENRLLLLLANRMLTSNEFVLTDEIDNALWPGHTSPDYVRKARNKTLERLETALQRIAPLDEGMEYILRRNYVYDNRKAEFGLNSKACRILDSSIKL